MARYRVPIGVTRVETRAGNSRFIADLTRADTLAAAHEFLRTIRAEFPDATHHVYAFRAGHGATVQEALSDDGEPSGTSGPPLLAVLRGSGLGDVALVVSRYFGGTKLGTGGLVTAYQAAAHAALQRAPTEERVDRVPLALDLVYALLEPVRRLVRECDGLIDDERFDADVHLHARIAVERRPEFERRLADLSSGRARVRPL